MTLGSLFDGIGGFPFSAAMCGIEPRWASEIEPFPILVTHKRFPDMKHLGSVTEINGAEIEPVDIITFGSPCQDLSVAGKQAGIHDGERSNLFFEAVRIIKEMRQKDEATGRTGIDVRPRYAVWENVPGAFSSNRGKDFQAVLQALAEVADPDVSIPFPDGGKWLKAGCIVGEGYSIAWRVYDAQYWGVPQRRKRIYLIADFGSERAGEVLFEPESLRGDSSQGGTPWKGTAADAEGSVVAAGFKAGNGAKSRTIGFREEVSPTLAASPSGANQVPTTVYCLQGNGIDRALTAGCNGKGWRQNECYTLNTIDRPAVVHAKAVYPNVTGSLCANSHPGSYTGQDAFNDMLPVQHNGSRYVIRRLTPLECCRLQGYPDGWTEDLAIPDPTIEEVEFFTKVWSDWAEINGTKPKSLNQILKWLADPHSDSAEYKAYGNSLAIPCSYDVLRRISENERTDHIR